MHSTSVIRVGAIGLAGFTFFASLAAPRFLPILLVLSGLLGTVAMVAGRSERLRTLWRNPIAVTLGLLLGYLFINASWAINADAALQKSTVVLCIAAAAVLLATYVADLEPGLASRAADAAILGFSLGLLYLMIDLATGRTLWIIVHNFFPFLDGGSIKNIDIEEGRIVAAGLYILNRNVTVAVLLLWPVFLLLADKRQGWRTIGRVAVVAAAAICIMMSESQTSLIALICSLGVYMATLYGRRFVKWSVLTVWVAGLALAVPLGAMPHKLGWTSWTWLNVDSAAARFYIWSYTADKVLERPIRGIGVRGTRELQQADGLRPGSGHAERFQLRPGRHAHNAFLQIWLELGAIGAGLVLAFGLAVLRQIDRLARHEAAVGYALFTTACTVAALGYGIWQTWFFAGFGLAAVGYGLGSRSREMAAS